MFKGVAPPELPLYEDLLLQRFGSYGATLIKKNEFL